MAAMTGMGVDAECATPYCPPPWHGFEGNCYQFIDLQKSWLEAEKHCQMLSHPGKMVHLASIHSNKEDAFIGSLVKSLKHSKKTKADEGESYWIGYHDIGHENVHQWIDETAAVYCNWATGEPNNYPESENCVEKYKQYASQKWNDFDCNAKQQFVCKL
ncbi:alpha-N-acetylgalactosamine-specific lectin-like [Asterias rubens]|uniref:alpha-N-acetylgalactosamine-specific lectin-like n=1 Tax=Asterias rubens TaxID=7604 RepID=UPI0014551B0F|nr:alpha-N-acetylgalactosamine-specific lectin-like [Asterias rubens]